MDKNINYDILDDLILNNCLNSLLSGNLSFINLFSIFDSFSNNDLDFNKNDFIRRLFFLIGMEYIEAEPMLSDFNEIKLRLQELWIIDENIINKFCNNKKFNNKTYSNHILFWKITANWIKRQEELKEKIESCKWIRWFFYDIKCFFARIFDYKYVIWIWLTVFCLILIFWFDVKVSGYIAKLPILSSIIDTDTLEQFEEINANDDFYQWLLQEFNSSIGSSDSSNSSVANWESQKINSSILKDIKVRKVSATEKIFRVKWPDWTEQFITVKRWTDGKLQITLPPKIKAIQDKIRNISLKIK